MKALTLWQPWASLIALGAKTIETRSWSTKYRGPLAIHAAKRRPATWWSQWGDTPKQLSGADPWFEECERWCNGDETGDGWWSWSWGGPLGAVVATCNLIDVVPMIDADDPPVEFQCSPPGRKYLSNWENGRMLLVSSPVYKNNRCVGSTTREVTDQLPYGDFTPGRFAWLLENVQPIPTIPAKGHQGLWEWTT
jgi:hypothetical protein